MIDRPPPPRKQPVKRKSEPLPAKGGGLQCPKCGCRHFEVTKVERREKVIRRRKQCRHCGRIVWTMEAVTGEDAPTGFFKWFKIWEW